MGANRRKTWRQILGDAGEEAALRALTAHHWDVENLNRPKNFPNADLAATKHGLTLYTQVKTYNDYRWVSGGGVNEDICDGAPLFNRVARVRPCEFVILLSPASPGDKKLIRDDWRFFVMPVADAAFRVNINHYFNQPKKDGSPRRRTGAVQDFVGPGTINLFNVPDHKEDYLRFQGAFHLLDEFALAGR